eukprot:TRINITY_DN40429_c0_g1_i1.p1 TRINITY_DN40429_c0_g1~~TRINITY_DN40429_c0_g1_i1.p1  ORF type:complete len:246 (-),score=23.40 TRINITY_DN40429_c0_g1_i1:525-1262(-)
MLTAECLCPASQLRIPHSQGNPPPSQFSFQPCKIKGKLFHPLSRFSLHPSRFKGNLSHPLSQFSVQTSKFKGNLSRGRQPGLFPCTDYIFLENGVLGVDESGRRVALVSGVLLLCTLAFAGPSHAAVFEQVLEEGRALFEKEPRNALSLPTWAIHVSSVAEWIIAMALVWQFGEKSGYQAWKGLSWGMVPLLGGAVCACTWHFFYNAETLDILVLMQAALTVVGNLTMSVAAFRIYESTKGRPED